MSRIGNSTDYGSIRWAAPGPTVAGGNNGKFNNTVTRTGVGVYEVTPAPSEEFAPTDTFKVNPEGSVAIDAVVERNSAVLLTVRTFAGVVGAAPTDANCELRWRKRLEG